MEFSGGDRWEILGRGYGENVPHLNLNLVMERILGRLYIWEEVAAKGISLPNIIRDPCAIHKKIPCALGAVGSGNALKLIPHVLL